MTSCPICESTTHFYEGERVGVGFGGGDYGVKCGPDHCDHCGYIEQGPDPDDKPIEYYQECWKNQVSPHRPIQVFQHIDIPERYVGWIQQHSPKILLGECMRQTYLLAKTFPELRIVRGIYIDHP